MYRQKINENLGGKIAGVNPYIGRDTEGFKESAAQKVRILRILNTDYQFRIEENNDFISY
ncbi:MAG: hypothetical protein C0412_10015 [Flavobacterium sp.]|nr:hypothetical protein [Flavobacterium sp.]